MTPEVEQEDEEPNTDWKKTPLFEFINSYYRYKLWKRGILDKYPIRKDKSKTLAELEV